MDALALLREVRAALGLAASKTEELEALLTAPQPEPEPEPEPDPEPQPTPSEPTAYGMTLAEYRTTDRGVLMGYPVMRDWDPKREREGVDNVEGLRYAPRGLTAGATLDFGKQQSYVVSDPGPYADFDVLAIAEHHDRTERWGATEAQVPDFLSFDAPRPLILYLVAPPGQNAPPAYDWFRMSEDLKLVGGTSKVWCLRFPAGRVELPGIGWEYRYSNSGKLPAFLASEADGSPYQPPHPDLAPGNTRSADVLGLLRIENPHLYVEGARADVFTHHGLVDRFWQQYGHFHTQHHPSAPVHYEVWPDVVERIPAEHRHQYPIGQNHDPRGTVRHADLWDFEYVDHRADTGAEIRIVTTLQGGSKHPDRITRREREVAFQLLDEDGQLILAESYKRPQGLSRVIYKASLDPRSPSGAPSSRMVPFYSEHDPDNPEREPSVGVLSIPMRGDGGYQNDKVGLPDLGVIGYLNWNTPGRSTVVNPDGGRLEQLSGDWVWHLDSDPSRWLLDDGRKGTKRWSNLNYPSGEESMRFSYRRVVERLVRVGWRGVRSAGEADEELRGQDYWYWTSWDGNVIHDDGAWGRRRQLCRPEAEFRLTIRKGSSTDDNRYFVDQADPDLYRPFMAGEDVSIDRNHSRLLTEGV